MSDHACTICTITPLEFTLLFHSGVNELSPGYNDALSQLQDLSPNLRVFQVDQGPQYQELTKDVSDVRLFHWQTETSVGVLHFHMFPSGIAIAQLMTTINSQDSHELESGAQQQTRQAFKESYSKICSLLLKWSQQTQIPLVNKKAIAKLGDDANIMWSARTLVLASDELHQPKKQTLLKAWLADTRFPEHAEQIISGERDHSLTWLNYAIVNPTPEDFRLHTMILAQYYYAAQEIRNRELKTAISQSYSDSELPLVGKLLSNSRVEARLLQINYHEHLKLLTRVKRKLLAEILEGWEFQVVVDNSERMIEVCSSRLEEADHIKRERSTMLTDFLLVTLSFLAVFELCLYLIEFSREMMSRPALDYNDEHTSFFLSTIAEIDTDIMFSTGIGLTVILVLFYIRIKGD